MNILEAMPKPFFVLAPMDDVTDTVFRQLIAELAPPDLFFTEFVNVDALQSRGREATLKRLKFTDKEKPLIAQIWGKNPDNFYKTAQELVVMGFDGVDINFGCPDKNVVRNGTCSAFILPENRDRAVQIITATREGLASYSPYSGGSEQTDAAPGNSSASLLVPKGTPSMTSELPGTIPDYSFGHQPMKSRGLSTSLPLSVKTRLGFNDVDFSWHQLLLEQKLNMLSIHGRTRKQMSKVPANWDYIEDVRKLRDQVSPSTLIVGNGDVLSHEQGEELARKHGLDGVMIGRGIFQDPYVFLKNSQWESVGKKERLDIYKRHIELFASTWQHGERKIHTLNKFCKIYIQGFENASSIREALMQSETTDELLYILNSAY